MPSDPDAPKPGPKAPSTTRKPTHRPDLAYPVDGPDDPPPPAPAPRASSRSQTTRGSGNERSTRPPASQVAGKGAARRTAANKQGSTQRSKPAAKATGSSSKSRAQRPAAKKPATNKQSPPKPGTRKSTAKKPAPPKPGTKKSTAKEPAPPKPGTKKPATRPTPNRTAKSTTNRTAKSTTQRSRATAAASTTAGTDATSTPKADAIPRSEPPNDVHFPVIGGIAALTALLVVLQGLSPVGHAFWDAVITMGFTFAVVVAGSRAVRDSLLGLTLVAFVFVGLSWWLVPAGGALGVVVMMMQSRVKRPRAVQRMIRAGVTGLAMLPLMHLKGLGFTGSASLLVALAVIPVLFTGYQAAPSYIRGRLRTATLALAGFVVFASVLSLISALAGRPAAEVAIQRATSGLDAARGGEQEEAVALLTEAQGHFDTAASRFGAWWASPARLVPIVAQNSRALEQAAEQGVALTSAAVRATTSADVDQVRGVGGQIDIGIVREVGAELALTASTLNNAQSELAGARSVWLLPIIDDRMESANEDLVEAADDVNLAAQATAVLPGILGADEPRTYLVIFTNPAESREFGGFGGAYALLEAVDGKVSLLDSGRGGDLNPPAHPVIPRPGLDDAELYPPLYLNFGQDGLANYFGNLTGTIDFPTIAAATQNVMPKKGQPEIDGLMIMDPFALAAVMELINRPIRVPELDAPLTSENVADYLLRGQYVDGNTTNEREDVLGAIAEQAFDSLLSISTPGPERLGAIFGPVARQKRMQFTTFNPDENAFLERVYLRSRLPTLPDFVDYFSVISDTAAPNKLDAYLRRDIVYDVSINPATGRFDGTVSITLHNEAPPGLPEYVQGFDDYYYDLAPGVQRERVSLYSSNDVFGVVQHDGVESASNEFFLEYGLNRRLTFIDVPPQSQRTITMTLVGTAAPGSYTVYLAAQPRVIDDSVTLNITPTPGWVVRHSGQSTFTSEFDLIEDTVLGVDFVQG